jgi:hypothetical protein
MATLIRNILNDEDIELLINNETVLNYKRKIEEENNNGKYKSIVFYLPINNESIINKINNNFKCNLTVESPISFKWISGDTPPHIDGANNQFNTHLIYLTENTGKLKINKEEYPILKGCGYIFNEGLIHETIDTYNSLKLILGPFSYNKSLGFKGGVADIGTVDGIAALARTSIISINAYNIKKNSTNSNNFDFDISLNFYPSALMSDVSFQLYDFSNNQPIDISVNVPSNTTTFSKAYSNVSIPSSSIYGGLIDNRPAIPAEVAMSTPKEVSDPLMMPSDGSTTYTTTPPLIYQSAPIYISIPEPYNDNQSVSFDKFINTAYLNSIKVPYNIPRKDARKETVAALEDPEDLASEEIFEVFLPGGPTLPSSEEPKIQDVVVPLVPVDMNAAERVDGVSNTIVNYRTSLFQSIITSISGGNFGKLNAHISKNVFPFTTDESTKLSFNGINQIRIIAAPTDTGDRIQIASGNSVGSRANPFDLSLLLPNQGLYIEFFNCANFIRLKKGNDIVEIILLGNQSTFNFASPPIYSGQLPFPYGQNYYGYGRYGDNNVILQTGIVRDGAMISLLGYNIVLGGALGTLGGPGETICFHKGTHILTPEGYKPVELLKAGDLITTTKNIKESILIKDMVKFIGKKADGALYCLPKDSLKKGKPLNDLYMSADHAYKHNGIWKHMKCASLTEFPHSRTKKYTRETDEEDIEYYHIVIEDYFAHTIVAEGVEVETCFKDNEDGILMIWSCDEKACTPLKCEKKKVEKNEQKKAAVVVNKRSMFSPYIKAEEPKPIVKPLLNIVKGAAANEQKNKKKNMTIWAYNKDLNKNMPLDCNEITLPM